MSNRQSRSIARLVQLWRRWRRHRALTRGSTALNLNLLEETILEHLYTRTAADLGLTWKKLGPVLRLEGGGRRFHFQGVWSDFDTMPVGTICGDKILVRDLLKENGLAVPDAGVVVAGDWRGALAIQGRLGSPVAVKPARGTSSGRGVSVPVAGAREMRRAVDLASLFCDELLVERFVPGENYRVLVYKGETISVLLRDLPSVTGDGVTGIRGLIDRENSRRVRSATWTPGDPVLLPLPAGGRTERVLARQSLTLQSVPGDGIKVRLGDTCNYSSGASYEEVYSRVHPAILRAAERAADLLAVTLAGVDVIAPNIGGEVYAINEVNTTPGLESHYFVRNQADARDPLRIILGDLFGVAPWSPPV